MIHGDMWKIPSLSPLYVDFTRHADPIVYHVLYLEEEAKFLIASDGGKVYPYSKSHSKSFPKEYHALSLPFIPSHTITAMKKSLLEKYFFAGYDDGTVCLFHVSISSPILRWTLSKPVVHIEPSPVRPSVFFVLDNEGTISIWDLLETVTEPRFEMQVQGCTCLNVVQKGTSHSAVYLGFQNGSCVVLDLANTLLERWENEDIELIKLLVHHHHR
jgi:WD40 repeat protein